MKTISKFGLTLLVVLFSLWDLISGQSFPSGCAYSSATGIPGIFTCDFTTVTLPLTFNTFSSPYPQRLVINNVNGQLPASSPTASFSGFSSMSIVNLDSNFPASLEIKCASNGNLVLFAGTFSGLSYMQELKITNCILSGGLPNNVFSDFGDLDSLIIDGGSINGLNADSLSGLNITKLSIPNALGMFAMMNLALNTNTFPSGFFYPLSKVKAIILDNLSTSSALSLPTDTFTQNTNVETLSLSHNSLTSLENNVLSSLGALNYLNLTGVKWACTCDSLWILSTFSTEGINAIGGPVCDTPSDYQDKRATTYYYNMCPQEDACRGTPGVVLGGECITYAMLFGDGGANVAILIISCIILISVLKTKQAVKEHPREVTSIDISTRGYRYSRGKKEAEARSKGEPAGLRWV